MLHQLLSNFLFSTKNIICIDGDGSFLMHMGSLAVIGEKKLKNLNTY